jgi:sensor histidine kinase YesM
MLVAVFLVLYLSIGISVVVHGHNFFSGSGVAKALGEFFTTGGAAAIATAWALHRRLREREAHALSLEASLADARLQALTSQLHPHFLFNTLNAASTLLHRDPAGADAMLGRLAELLRATLRQPAEHEIPLREEMALLERYVDIMRIRHGARLTVDTSLPADAAELLVPAFVLQPLVENAIEHGVARRAGPGAVSIRAERVANRLRLEVADDGPGVAGSSAQARAASGIGLSNTRRRLEQLYGDAQRLTLQHERGVGTRAVVELPARPAGVGGDQS